MAPEPLICSCFSFEIGGGGLPLVNRQVTGMHTLFPLLPPKHNKVSDDPGLYLVTLTKCLGELGVNCPRVSLPELEEMGTERVLLVNWGLLSDLVTPSNTFLLFGGKRGGTQNVAGMLG